MKKKRTIRIDSEELAKTRSRRRFSVSREGPIQNALIAVGIAATFVGWVLYLVRAPICFGVLGLAGICIMSAMMVQFLKTS